MLKPTKINTTPARKGDKISLEIKGDWTEGEEWGAKCIYDFKINNRDMISGHTLHGLIEYGALLPCIAMSSRGAAVKLLNDIFWMDESSVSKVIMYQY